MRGRGLKYLSQADWTIFEHKSKRRTYSLGNEIVRAGSRVDHLYVIHTGSASVELPCARSMAVLAMLGVGDVFGEIAFFGDGVATAFVIAKDVDVQVDALHVADLRALCEEIPSFGLHMFQSLADSLASRLKNTSAELIRALNVRNIETHR